MLKFHMVNDPGKKRLIGWVLINQYLKASFFCGEKYDSIYLHIDNEPLSYYKTRLRIDLFDFEKEKIEFTVTGLQVDTYCLTLSEGEIHIKMTTPSPSINGDVEEVMLEHILVTKFQWLVMQKRFDDYKRVTIEVISNFMETKQWRLNSPVEIKGTIIFPFRTGIVRVVNRLNPDGFTLTKGGEIHTPDFWEIFDSLSELQQDQLSIKLFYT